MIRRPLPWLLAAYLAGIICYSHVLFLLLAGISLLIFIGGFYRKRLHPMDRFLYIMPLFLLAGAWRMQVQSAPGSIEDKLLQKTKVLAMGQVETVSGNKDSYQVTLKDCKITFKDGTVCDASKILLYASLIEALYPGLVIKAEGVMFLPERPGNPGQFDEYAYYKSKNIEAKLFGEAIHIIDRKFAPVRRLFYHIKSKMLSIFEALLPEKHAGVISAMLLGEKSLIDPEVKLLYQENGIAHILAISGLHVSILGMSVFSLLRHFKAPIVFSVLLVILLVLFYGILTNFSVSCIRTVIMLIFNLSAKLLGRTYDPLSALAAAGLILLIQSPMELYQAGFQFSFMAILGICLVYPKLRGFIKEKSGIVGKLIDTVLLSFGIQIATLPILLYHYFEFPPYAVFLNMIVIPLMTLLLLFSIFGGLFGLLSFGLGSFFSGPVYYILEFYEMLCSMAGKLPFQIVLIGRPSFFIILSYYLCILFILYCRIPLKKTIRGVFLMASLLVLFFRAPRSGLKTTFLDVGQGESICLALPSGTTILVDGGSLDVAKVGKYRLIPFLKSQGTKQIDFCFITHTDRDHINGIMELFLEMEDGEGAEGSYNGNILVRKIILPLIGNPDLAYQDLVKLALRKGVEVAYFGEGDRLIEGEFRMDCLFPVKEMIVKDRNDASLVLDITYGRFDLLLTGDLGTKGEKKIIEKLKPFGYEVLKVGHHGSAYSSSRGFLEKILPLDLSVISCGKGNTYGHPHQETLDRLGILDCLILTTKDYGAIMIWSDAMKHTITLNTLQDSKGLVKH